jgi:nitroreductase
MRRRDLLLGATTVTVGGTASVLLALRQMGSMYTYDSAAFVMRTPLSQSPEVRDLVRFAALAANSHNTQAWRFGLVRGAIEIRPDLNRRLVAVDPDNHHLYASL